MSRTSPPSYYPRLIYGFYEILTDSVLDLRTIDDEIPDVRIYATGIIRGEVDIYCYGVEVDMDFETGHINITDYEQEQIRAVYKKYLTYLREKDVDDDIPELGVMTVIAGDFRISRSRYSLAEEVESEQESESG